jgi:RNA polymerase sigma-70 factor, ECF subfamily
MTETTKIKDEELMLNFQNGDDAAFDKIVAKYKNLLLNFVYRYLGNYEESLDIVQETFIRVYVNRKNYKNIAKFSTWIYTIAANLAKTELRRKNRFTFFPVHFFSSEDDRVEFDIPDTSFSPDVETDKKLKSKIIQKALKQISPAYRQVVILRDVMELSYDEISVITRLRIGTIKSRINRGRSALQKLLKNIHNE